MKNYLKKLTIEFLNNRTAIGSTWLHLAPLGSTWLSFASTHTYTFKKLKILLSFFPKAYMEIFKKCAYKRKNKKQAYFCKKDGRKTGIFICNKRRTKSQKKRSNSHKCPARRRVGLYYRQATGHTGMGKVWGVGQVGCFPPKTIAGYPMFAQILGFFPVQPYQGTS